MALLLAFAVFCLVLAAGLALVTLTGAWREKEKQRRLNGLVRPALPVELPLGRQTAAATRRPGSSGLRLFGGSISLNRLEALLGAADVAMPPQRFLVLALAAGLLGFYLTLAVSRSVAAAVILMGICAGLPVVYLLVRRKSRDQALVRQLPDALDMIVRALRVGQSVDNALKEVGRNSPEPLGTEVRTIYEETALGLSFVAALQNFEARFARLADVKLMTTAFIIQRETGGNLTRVLANLADLIRERDTLQRQVRALTAEGRASAMIVGLLPVGVGLFFFLVQRHYIEILFTHRVGRKMVLAALVLEIAGFVTMRLMTRINP